MIRQYIRSHKAWYAQGDDIYNPTLNFEIVDENCDFSIKWLIVCGKLVPKLEVFDDSWAVLSKFQDLFDRMAKVNDLNISEPEFCEILKELGMVDATQYENPETFPSKASKEFLAFLHNRTEDTGSDRSSLRDMLTDIMHVCDEQIIDFNDLLKGAGEVANEEGD